MEPLVHQSETVPCPCCARPLGPDEDTGWPNAESLGRCSFGHAHVPRGMLDAALADRDRLLAQTVWCEACRKPHIWQSGCPSAVEEVSVGREAGTATADERREPRGERAADLSPIPGHDRNYARAGWREAIRLQAQEAQRLAHENERLRKELETVRQHHGEAISEIERLRAGS